MSSSDPDVIIIGGGLAGMACALELFRRGFRPLVLEASDAPGGRVRSDIHEGFVLDRGFQVLQTAYPEAQRLLDYEALELCPFRPGALIRWNGRFHRLGDPWRHWADALPTLLSPVGTFADKLRIAWLRHRVTRGTLPDLYARPETTALEALRAAGLSDRIIERFLRPFLAGVFFDRELGFSSRAFEFVFRAFADGDVALPANGMGDISKQLSKRLPAGTLRYHSRVRDLKGRTVVLDSYESYSAPAVVLATPAHETARLLGDTVPIPYQSTTCLYFAAPEPPIREPLLVLNGEAGGIINSLLVPSVISASYAPHEQALVTVNLLGNPPVSDTLLEMQVRNELQDWFGNAVTGWRRLRIYRIAQALPLQTPPVAYPEHFMPMIKRGIFVCGEYRSAPSIQWALVSGRRAAEAVVAGL